MEYNINAKKITNSDIPEETLLEIRKFFGFLDDEEFYAFMNKCSAEYIDSLCNAIFFYNCFDKAVDNGAFFLRALLMIFVIEGATFSKGYIDFYQWLKQNETNLDLLVNKDKNVLREQIDLFYKEYKNQYGDSKNFNRLFTECLEFKEKLRLIKSFSYLNNEREGCFCYDKEKGCCDDTKCYLKNNKETINSPLKKIVEMLFDFRCDFAHRAKFNPFTYLPKKEDYYEPFLISEHDGKLLKIELTENMFEDLARKIIYRYLNK
jgi:hypothetical protein